MMLLALLGNLAFTIVGAVIGIRLLRLSRRTGQRPELYVGGALALYALVTQPLLIASRPLGMAFGEAVWLSILALALVALVASFTGVYAFTRIAFRPDSAAATAAVRGAPLVSAAAALTLLHALAGSGGPGAAYSGVTRASIGVLALVFSIGMGWTAVEALRYHRMLRRRLALGLTDPVMVDRFHVWGIGCSACSLMAVSNVAFAAMGLKIVAHPAPLMTVAVTGTAISVCWYLSFLPPEGYLRRVRERAAASAV